MTKGIIIGIIILIVSACLIDAREHQRFQRMYPQCFQYGMTEQQSDHCVYVHENLEDILLMRQLLR